MSGKGKRKFLPLSVKLEALKRLDKGETLKKLAAEYGVSEVTVGDWRRNREKIDRFSSGKLPTYRKSIKKSDYEKTSEALFQWFSHQNQKGNYISGQMLQEKALFFRNELKEGEGDFTASAGWLDRWKRRYGVRHLETCSEKLSANSKTEIMTLCLVW